MFKFVSCEGGVMSQPSANKALTARSMLPPCCFAGGKHTHLKEVQDQKNVYAVSFNCLPRHAEFTMNDAIHLPVFVHNDPGYVHDNLLFSFDINTFHCVQKQVVWVL